MQQYQIVIIRPQGYVHSEAFSEIAETLVYALRKMSKTVTLDENNLNKNAVNIILGANLIKEEDVPNIPPNAIIYNFEQLTKSSSWMTSGFIKILKSFEVWDYSKNNIEYLKINSINKNPKFVPLGYVEELSRIEKRNDQDIDVLFYGSINNHRQKILDDLHAAGLKIEVLFGVYGKKRDEYIARSKVIVNVHFYEINLFELVRVSYLLANRKAVVSECSHITKIDEKLRGALVLVPYDQIVSACVELVNDANKRAKLEESGYQIFSSMDECEILASVLDKENGPSINNDLSPAYDPDITLPQKINIGSGKDFKADFLNIDCSGYWNPDVVVDLSAPDLINKKFKTERFGEIVLASNAFDEIVANDVLEHIPDLVTAMTNCLELLKENGEFKIIVPYDLSYGAWQDPTHVRAFNQNSWLYYTDWFWYLGWNKYRFDLSTLNYSLSPSGQQLYKSGHVLNDIITKPRAVDSMSVVLKKRHLTIEEKEQAIQMSHQKR